MHSNAPFTCFRQRADARLPQRALEESIGYDVYAYLRTESGRESSRLIPPQGTISLPTGIVVRPPPGYCVLVCSRSGLATRSIFVANAPGVIDPDYVGELRILLFNGGWEPHWVKHEDRVAQLLLFPIPDLPPVREIDKLPTTLRGERGFGSTGD